jgi:ABC-type sulfate transport system substrate-binding protein
VIDGLGADVVTLAGPTTILSGIDVRMKVQPGAE